MKHRSLCPISLALDLFGDKWSLLVIRDAVFCGARYFKDFKAAKENISTNILADRLKSLENDGFLKKEKDPSNAKQFIYTPTALAFKLVPTLVELGVFSSEYYAKAIPTDVTELLNMGRTAMIDTFAKMNNNR
ncbi:winged helix-turn-helix transcriptional regulator [Pectobacterium polaris]|uniref:winged helix-turn-helix transcriptional regulator n=1 Tax=Pectobacterium polaris TaxID=2042057 RepID=UPI00202D73EA|nr:helix-turn-helix domain-containing protein [Pectobacterium polaris]MCL6324406.1 transcriptional regulator [Pectobacterium polaris]